MVRRVLLDDGIVVAIGGEARLDGVGRRAGGVGADHDVQEFVLRF